MLRKSARRDYRNLARYATILCRLPSNLLFTGTSLHGVRTFADLRWEDHTYTPSAKTGNSLHWLGDGRTHDERMSTSDLTWYLYEAAMDKVAPFFNKVVYGWRACKQCPQIAEHCMWRYGVFLAMHIMPRCV
ncbi:hypothetical protein OF83DRAFT_694608 [Amylostereum chailletii]|nr:hypothetical protein OF83DRAFT_694608 [Amylostereum chailletii]